jgi:hypothetical protein
MANTRWLDRTQPQTLQSATILGYLNAGIALLTGEFLFVLGLIVIAGGIAGGWGIANEKKWGYWLALGVAVMELAFNVLYVSLGSLITLVFWTAMVALLLHPQSREYRKTWFR